MMRNPYKRPWPKVLPKSVTTLLPGNGIQNSGNRGACSQRLSASRDLTEAARAGNSPDADSAGFGVKVEFCFLATHAVRAPSYTYPNKTPI